MTPVAPFIEILSELFDLVQKGSSLYPQAMTKLSRYGQLQIGAAFVLCKVSGSHWFLCRLLVRN